MGTTVIQRPCIGTPANGYVCPDHAMATGGRRGPRCPRCQSEYDRTRNGLVTRHPYLDPRYRQYPIAGRMCALQIEGICTGRATTRDHIVPLAKGGTNDWDNLQPACRECNSAKRAGITDTPPL